MKLLQKYLALGSILFLISCATAPTAIDESNIPDLSVKERNLLTLARASENSQDITPAEKLYKQAIKLSKGNIGSHLALANLYDRNGQRKKAIKLMENAKKIQPNNPIINQQLGKYYISQGDGEKALTLFENGLKREPNNTDLLNGRAVSLDMTNNHKQAQATYRKALISSNGEKDFIYNNLAMSYIFSQNYREAIDILLSIKKKDATMRQNLAMSYALMGNEKQALIWGQKDLSEQTVKENLEIYKSYKSKMFKLEALPMDKPKI